MISAPVARRGGSPPRSSRAPVLILAVLALVALAGCEEGDWFGAPKPKPLPGKRETVLTEAPVLKPDAPPEKVALPRPERVADWPQAGGFPPHAMLHLAVGGHLRQAWTAEVGAGGEKRRAFITQPIVAHGRVYALDADSVLSAYRLTDGRRLWQVDLSVSGAAGDGSYGGGIAYDAARIYVTTGFDQLVKLDSATGRILWRHNLSSPVRGAPTVRAGRLLLVNVVNETIALAATDGHELWHHDGLEEQAMLMGGTSPAVDGDTVVSAYSSGEIYGLRIENGTILWTDTLSTLTRTNEVATLSDIRGLPVIYRGRVYAAGNADILAALDFATGRRLWEREVGSIQTPWVAGNYLFVITDAPELVCFRADTGQVVWVTRLAEWEDPENKDGKITWAGPVLASNRLILASSAGIGLAVSPYTGKELGQIQLPGTVTIPPIVADETVIFLTDDGELVAYR